MDGAEGQPGLLPKRGNQAHYVDPQTLPPHHHTVQLRRWHTAVLTARAGAGDVSVLSNLHRNLGQVNYFPSALGPATGQLTVGTALARPFGLGRFPVGFGLQTGHPTRAPGFGRPFQLGNPFLQPLDDDLLPDDDGDEDIPVGSGEVDFPIHIRYMA